MRRPSFNQLKFFISKSRRCNGPILFPRRTSLQVSRRSLVHEKLSGALISYSHGLLGPNACMQYVAGALAIGLLRLSLDGVVV
jgi:hypothetical protein